MHFSALILRRLWICLTMAALAAPLAQAQSAPKVRFVTSDGEFVVEVYPDKAPKTVENFLQYVRDKHYDGTLFHRVIDGFMIQGGGFDTRFQQKPTRPPVAHEGRESLSRGGPLNLNGTIAMARTNDPHSATAQFFINVKDNGFLDPVPIPPGDPVPHFQYQGRVFENVPRANLLSAPQLFGYVAFGRVISGMDVITKIKVRPTGAGGPFPGDVPRTPVIILSATELP